MNNKRLSQLCASIKARAKSDLDVVVAIKGEKGVGMSYAILRRNL